MKLRFIEPFAGIGGFRYGLEKTNDTIAKRIQQRIQQRGRSNHNIIKPRMGAEQFNCVWANEWNKYASQIYRKNFGRGELQEGDIRDIPAESIPDHEIFTAGFPCQPFSIAGKQKGFKDTRGNMFLEICRITKVKKPYILLLENVKGLLNHEGGKTFGIILNTLSELGYDCEWQVLNSKNFGVPQNRERVFIIGHLRGATRGKVFPIGKDDRLFNEEGEPNQRPSQARYSRTIRGTEMKADHTFIMHKDNVKAIIQKTRADDTFIIHPDIYKEGRIRRFTPTECERLQGFLDGWTEGLSDTQRYKCLGNAVTTNIITEIGKRILEILK